MNIAGGKNITCLNLLFFWMTVNPDLDSVIYKARELYPILFPGINDFSCWVIGRTWRDQTNRIVVNVLYVLTVKKFYKK